MSWVWRGTNERHNIHTGVKFRVHNVLVRHTHRYTHKCTHTHAYINTCIDTQTTCTPANSYPSQMKSHTNSHKHTNTQTHTHTHPHPHTKTHPHPHPHTHTHTHTHTRTRTYTPTHKHTHTHLPVHVLSALHLCHTLLLGGLASGTRLGRLTVGVTCVRLHVRACL